MKRILNLIVVALLVAAAAAVVVYRLMNRMPSADLPQNEQIYRIFDDGGCLSCHSAEPELPYFSIERILKSYIF